MYVINEAMPNMPGAYHEIQASSYREEGTRYVFYDDQDNEVFAMAKQYVQTIRKVKPDTR